MGSSSSTIYPFSDNPAETAPTSLADSVKTDVADTRHGVGPPCRSSEFPTIYFIQTTRTRTNIQRRENRTLALTSFASRYSLLGLHAVTHTRTPNSRMLHGHRLAERRRNNNVTSKKHDKNFKYHRLRRRRGRIYVYDRPQMSVFIGGVRQAAAAAATNTVWHSITEGPSTTLLPIGPIISRFTSSRG